MAQATDPFLVRAELESLLLERDTALAARARVMRESELAQRQLIEEQDRFVAHLLEKHELEVARMKTELAKAAEHATRLERELGIARAMLDDAMGATTPREGGRFKSAEPVSGPHASVRSARESGIVGKLGTPKLPDIKSNRR